MALPFLTVAQQLRAQSNPILKPLCLVFKSMRAISRALCCSAVAVAVALASKDRSVQASGGSPAWPWADPQTMAFPTGMNLTVDVKECCGAVGDGKHDDTHAIQTAINQTGHYTLLFFPKGRYLVSDTLNFYSDKGLIVSRRNVQGAGVELSTIVLKD